MHENYFQKKKPIVLFLLLMLVTAVVYLIDSKNLINDNKISSNLGKWDVNNFYTPLNTKHFLSSEPAQKDILHSLPEKVFLTFDTPLESNSFIKVENMDENYTQGGIFFSDDKKTMSVNIDHNAIEGMYVVMYTACFLNEQALVESHNEQVLSSRKEDCQDGYFRFLLDRSKK